jgi:hypothetical protein
VDGSTRVVFFDGQRLAADDLNGAADQLRQLRWLHNRSLHGWGIGLGFAATGAAGDRQVTVEPGYAIDCLGRELVLTEPVTLAVPARSGDDQGKPVAFALVAAYPDDRQLVAAETRAGECGGTPGAVRLRERAAIYWRQPPLDTGREILLASALVQNCKLAQPLAVDQTRRARAFRVPYVAAGETAPAQTPWEPWIETPASDAAVMIGVKAKIDTSAARFAAPPCYQAELRGPRFFGQTVGDTDPPILLDGTLIVADPVRDQFTVMVLMPQFGRVGAPLTPPGLFVPGPNGRDALIALVQQQWGVAWIGVEN